MRVLLLNPPFLARFSRSQRSPAVTKSGTLYYPIWLAYAAGVLLEAGFEVKLIDAVAARIPTRKLLGMVKEFDPRLIVVDTSTPSIYNDVAIAGQCKSYSPDSFLVLVGPHVGSLPEETLGLNSSIDAVARGEYDYTLRGLGFVLEEKKALEGVLGLSFRRGTELIHNPDRPPIVDLDRIPFVTRAYKRFLNPRDYFFAASDWPEVQLFTARGCPFQCFFCLSPQVMQGRVYRARSPVNVANEFEFVAENLPEVKEIVIEDDTFSVDPQRTAAICELLIKKNNSLPWNANVRADLDLGLMIKMKAAGCRLLIVGFESGDQDILDKVAKGISVEQARQFSCNAKKAGLLVHAAFMAGNPGETSQTLAKTFKLAKELFPDTVQFFPLMVYPGTAAFNWAKNNNVVYFQSYRDWITQDGLHNCLISFPGLGAADIVNWCDNSRRSYYLSPRYLLYKLRQIVVHPREARRTLKAAMRFSRYLFRSLRRAQKAKYG